MGLQRTLSRLALATVAVLLVGGPSALGQSAHSYQGPLLPDPALQAMRVDPIWRDRLDSATAVVTGSAAVYLREGRLVATELTSGWQQWSYGSGLTGPLLLAADRVLVAEGPWVSALHASEGRVLWSRNVSGAPVRHMRLTPGALLVSSGEAGAALLNLETGEVVRTLDVPAGTEPLFANGALALFGSEHAEPGETWLHAFDLHSGLELWRTRGERLLAAEQDLLYLLELGENRQPTPAGGFAVAVRSAASGALVQRWRYGFAGLTQRWTPRAGRVIMTGDALYATDVEGRRLFRFPPGGASAPVTTFRAPGGGYFRAGPYDGLLFFEDEGHRLVARALVDGRNIVYSLAGATVSRLDLIGERAFVGRTDGTLMAVDLATARPRYLVRTGGTGFGPTLEAGRYRVLQTTGEILVVEDLE